MNTTRSTSRQLADQRPAEGEVRVLVSAMGITALGTQVAGTVDAVSKDSVGFIRGDRVSFRAAGPIDSARVVVPEHELMGVPADVDLDAAAALVPCALLARTVVRQVRPIARGERVHVADASLDERWADNPFVDGRWGRVRFYGAYPLLSPSGFAVGTLCVFDDRRMPYKAKVTDTMSWGDIPTCKESGVPTDYVMLRGIFMPAGVNKDQLEYYTTLLKKVRETPDWKDYMEKGAFNQTSMAGDDFTKWLGMAEQMHRNLMKEAGFIAN